MKNITFFSFVIFCFLSCSNVTKATNTTINIGEQSIKLLPLKASNQKFESSELIKNIFKPFNINVQDFNKSELFWPYRVYKHNETKPYYGLNLQKIDKEWFLRHYINSNQSNLGEISKPAITIKNTSIRLFPTNEPLFYNPKKAGEGYPFDYLQASSIAISKPLFISHLSKDKAWAFVKDDTIWGWIEVGNFKFLSNKETKKYQKSKFLTIKIDKTPVYNSIGDFLFYAKVGSMLPYINETKDKFFGEIQTTNGKQKYTISKKFANKYPLEFNNENLKDIIGSILGSAYGWGGINDLRDCSLMTKNILEPFGIWLPRNSYSQSKIGKEIDLSKLSNNEKIKTIKKHGLPYLTLLYIKGHIMLYIGEKDKNILVLHDIWGLKTKNNGRAIIGKIAITPLNLGEKNKNIGKKNTLISKIQKMNILKF